MNCPLGAGLRMAVFLAASTCVLAQTPAQSSPPLQPAESGTSKSAIDVVVTDQSGAVIPNANISIRRFDSHVTMHGKTNEAGQFHSADLAQGKYLLMVNSLGFYFQWESIDLGPSETRKVSMTLWVAPSPVNGPPPGDAVTPEPQLSTVVPEFLPEPIADLPLGGGPTKLVLKDAPQHPNSAKHFFSTLGHKLGFL